MKKLLGGTPAEAWTPAETIAKDSFYSKRAEAERMLQRIAETMAWRSHRPGEQERRLAQKVPVEFVL